MTLLEATVARDYGALGKGRSRTRVSVSSLLYGAGDIECPRPALTPAAG